MTVKRATFDIESTKQAAFYEEEAERPGSDRPMSALIVEVQDFEEALEIVDTLNRSRAQKKRERKPAEIEKGSPPPPAVASAPPAGNGRGAAEEVAGCEAPDCRNEGMVSAEGGHFCPLHAAVDLSILREWHAAALKRKTPAKEGAKRARAIVESVS